MVTRRKCLTKEDLDAALEVFGARPELEALRSEMVVWKDEIKRAFDVGVETIRSDIKLFAEQKARYDGLKPKR